MRDRTSTRNPLTGEDAVEAVEIKVCFCEYVEPLKLHSAYPRDVIVLLRVFMLDAVGLIGA